MTIGERIKARRKELFMSAEQLAERVGISPSTIYRYENGAIDSVDAKKLLPIADALMIEPTALMGLGESSDFIMRFKQSEVILSEEAKDLASDFDRLDPPGKRTVHAVIESELQRIEEAQPKRRKAHPVDTVPVTHYIGASAAGSPLYAESDAEIVEYPEDVVPDDADYSVTLSGHSMEPDYPDGCTVFVSESQRVRNGDIVLAWLPSEQGSVCKRIVLSGEQLVRLESINKAYEDYTGESLQGALVFGKVIGRA